jgi:hypothetical protein
MHRLDKKLILQLNLFGIGHTLNRYMFLKSIIFWDMTRCSPLSINRCFGGTYRLYLQGRRNRFRKLASKQVADGGDKFLRNVGWYSTDYTASYPRRWYSSKPPLWKPQILQIHVFIGEVLWFPKYRVKLNGSFNKWKLFNVGIDRETDM